MDKENVMFLHNGVLLHCQKQWHLKISSEIGGTRKKNHPGWANLDPECYSYKSKHGIQGIELKAKTQFSTSRATWLSKKTKTKVHTGENKASSTNSAVQIG